MSDPFRVVDRSSKRLASGADFVQTTHNHTYPFIFPEQFNLRGRSVFITGASRGIGRETALSFARAGVSRIGVGSRSSFANLKEDLGQAAINVGHAPPQVLMVQLNVEDYLSAERAAEEVRLAFEGTLDILINNAGYHEPVASIVDSRPQNWHKTYTVNVFGVYHVTRAFVPLLLAGRQNLKTIITVTAVGAHLFMPGASGYHTAKLASLRFAEFVNAEYGSQGILSYSINPGAVRTDLAKDLGQEFDANLTDTPQLAADSIVWLTSEKRQWLSGRYVSVTWDMRELLEKRARVERDDLLKIRLAVGFA